jgi:putative oxidoreductase
MSKDEKADFTAAQPLLQQSSAEDTGIRILRYTLAILLGIHGVTRIVIGGVSGFGEFLLSQGIHAGVIVAWAITIFELIGSAALLLRLWVLPVSVLFIIELAAGIKMVHLQEGWFVVGAGRNGIEYSVLLIMGLLSVAISTKKSSPSAK